MKTPHTFIGANGEFKNLPPANGEAYELDELHKAVGGYIQIVYTRFGNMMVVDEEGLIKEKPFNIAASEIAGIDIVGDAVLCHPDLVK